MMNRLRAHQPGFTLIEAIVAMTITGILAGVVTVFMVTPIRAYLDAVRRAEMTDAADTALRRIGFELRAAVPNTVRIDGTASFLEFVPAQDGGRYRVELTAGGGGDILNATSGADTSFNVLGPAVNGDNGDFVVIYNTGQVGLDVYAGNNRRVLSAAAGATVTFTATGTAFPPYLSPFQRFQIVPASGPVTFACNGGRLLRHTGYGFNAAQAVASLGAPTVVANNIAACNFTYNVVSAHNGLLTLALTLTRENESVTLQHEIHIDNVP